MNKIFSKIGLAVLLLAGTTSLTSCEENDFDMIGTSSNQEPYVTSQTSVGEVNATILEVKERFCSNSATATFFRNDKNFYSHVDEDIVITGVVVANDISGNLYQTLLLRNIEPSGEDQCIILGVKNTCLYPYFQLGQRIKVNLKGLYVGNYSKVPTIGQPYFTSSGNLRLGAMLLGKCATNVELVGQPNPACPECQPIERTPEWLRATANRTYLNFPQLVTVTGTLAEADGTATYAPEELQDAGYAVDRTITNTANNTKVTLRTSTDSPIAFEVMPQEECRFTGILTYYSEWQVQLRTLDDVKPVNEQN